MDGDESGGPSSSLDSAGAERSLLQQLASAYRSTAEAGAEDDAPALAALVSAYRGSEAVRFLQRLPGRDPERLEGRGIYPTVHELGGTDHDSYLARNGRWRVHRRAGRYRLQRLFGGQWREGDEGWTEIDSPILTVELGSSSTNVTAFERALAIDVQDGLWPPARLDDQYENVVRRLTSCTTSNNLPAANRYATLDWDGEIETFCVLSPDQAAKGDARRIERSLPMAVALLRAHAGEQITWSSPAGEQSATVLKVRDEPTTWPSTDHTTTRSKGTSA